MTEEGSWHTVRLGSTRVEVSPLTPASWSFAGRMGPMGPSLLPEEVEAAFHGLGLRSYFVTPRMDRLAEGLRRLIAAGHREQLTLISPAGIPLPGLVHRYIRRFLKALGTDYLDVLLMGWIQHPFYLRERVWTAFQDLKDTDRIRAAGFSAHDRLLASRLAARLDPPPDVLMIRYNAAHRGAEAEVFDHLREPRPGIIAYTATRWGDLLEPTGDPALPPPMRPHECYQFDLNHPAVDTVLCGARSLDELREDVEGVRGGRIHAARYAEILRLGDEVHRTGRRSARFMFRQG